MKFALVCDSVIAVESYLSRDGKVYKLKDGTPYRRDRHISNEILMGFWNFPILFDGYFLNLQEGLYPDEKIDLIFVAIEKDITYLHKLRELYPTAKFVGTMKEPNTNKTVRNQLINELDTFVHPYLTFDFFDVYGYDKPKNVEVIPQPININLFRTHFSNTKNNMIFDYANTWTPGRSGKNKSFLDKLDIPHKTSLDNDWETFVNSWKDCKYLLNLDPTPNLGQQTIQCATLGTLTVGGLNDATKILFPDLATMDENVLLEKIGNIESNTNYYKEILNHANDKLNQIYSFESVKQKIKNLNIINT